PDLLNLQPRAAPRLDALLLDHRLLVRGLGAHEARQQLDVVEDPLERAVDLVAERDGHLAERRQAVALPDLADILGKADRADLQTVVVVENRSRYRHRNLLAPAGDEGGLEILHLAQASGLVAAQCVPNPV